MIPEPRRSLCDKCGTQHQHYQNCPAYGLECYNCGSRNQFSKVCRSRPLSTQHRKVHSVTHDESDDFFIGMIQCATTKTPRKMSILVNRQRISFKIDTGTQCNVIFKSRYHQLSSLPLHKSDVRLLHSVANACGKITIECEYIGHTHAVSFEVIDQDVPNILGLQTCVNMNLVQHLDAMA